MIKFIIGVIVGGYIVHIGILMMFLGFTGKAFDKEADVSLSPSKNSAILDEYKFELKNYWKDKFFFLYSPKT